MGYHFARGMFLGVLLVANASCDLQPSDAPGSGGLTKSGGATSTGGVSATGGVGTGGTTAGTGGTTRTGGGSTTGGTGIGGAAAGTGGATSGGSGGTPSGGGGGSNDSGGQGDGGGLGNPLCVGSVRSGDKPCAKDAACLNDLGQYCGCGESGVWFCGNI